MNNEFSPTPLENAIDVTHIVTLHDFKYTPDFLFTGESHDFWEIAFIRRGSVGVMAGNTGYTIMDYYTNLKISRAKILIQKGEMSFSDIAELLGYSSIHYFSRVFKKKTGLSPTEYKFKKSL